MKRLTDADIERMASENVRDLDAAALKTIRKSLKIKAEQGEIPGKFVIPRFSRGAQTYIDCHGKPEEQAFAEINAKIGQIQQCLSSHSLTTGTRSIKSSGASQICNELIIITGKSGIIKRNFHISITEGYLKNQIKSWKLINDGCYKIRIKKPNL